MINKQYIINILIAYLLAASVFIYNEYRMGKLDPKPKVEDTPNPILKELDPLNVIPDETKDIVVDEAPLKNILIYSGVNLQYAKASGKVLLYFTSNNCQRCTGFIESLEANTLPNDVIVIIVDFNKERTLSRKYNVQTADTIVQIDENDKELTKWRFPSEDNILQNIK